MIHLLGEGLLVLQSHSLLRVQLLARCVDSRIATAGTVRVLVVLDETPILVHVLRNLLQLCVIVWLLLPRHCLLELNGCRVGLVHHLWHVEICLGSLHGITSGLMCLKEVAILQLWLLL